MNTERISSTENQGRDLVEEQLHEWCNATPSLGETLSEMRLEKKRENRDR